MLKRLSFALVAISFSVPVVACLNSTSEETTAGDANMLSDADRAACNFGFAETTADAADPSFDPPGKKDQGLATSARAFVFGDATGDHNVDLLTVTGKGEVSLFPGKGDGHFNTAVKTSISAPSSYTPSAVALAGMGDFDGDGLKDFVAMQTVFGLTPVKNYVAHYVVGYGKADGSFDVVALPFGISEKDHAPTRLAQWSAVADLDGDGKDDLVVGGTETEVVYFGEATRKLTLGKTGLVAGGGTAIVSDRVLMFASAKTGLVVNNSNHSWKVTFGTDRMATVVDSQLAVPSLDMKVATDLDGDDRPELTLFDTGADKLVIQPLGANAPDATKFVKFKGSIVDNIDFSLDLAHDQKRELIFKTDSRKLFAACGYSAKTQEIIAAELPVAYGDKTVVVGTPDLNGDGKPDFTTYNFGTKAFKVFLGAAPPVTVPPQLSFYAEGYHPPTGTDAGPMMDDGGPIVVVTDAGPEPTDAGPEPMDAGPEPTDAGPDPVEAGPNPVDGGKHPDAGKPDAGHPHTDGGQVPGDDDDDDDTVGGDDDDDDDDVVAPKDAGKNSPTTGPSSNSSSTSGSITVTVKPKPADDDDGGCSAAPGHSSSSGSLALGGVVALMLLGGRRRRKSA